MSSIVGFCVGRSFGCLPFSSLPVRLRGGGIVRKGGGGAEKRSRRDEEDQSYYHLVGMKEANHFRTMVFLVMLERSGGKIYSNFANATASPPTCVMP